VAAADAAIGRLLRGLEAHFAPDEMIVVFAANHGESLGEHDYWGHGRYLYEPSLRTPLGIHWKGTVEQRVIERQATILDIAPTILELLDLETDPGELVNLIPADDQPSDRLLECLGKVSEGLGALDRLTSRTLDDETVEQLRALGYIE
jgi:arylsulfatase A-like enzyme